ncbi:flippase [Phytohabitans kaempferiae]|uniref:Flippase n=1 Tax=Phytohabitans kaempferiae TaxID=1620943 RepID=A0ABV6MH79_9ACTN
MTTGTTAPPPESTSDYGDRQVRGMARGGGLNLLGALCSQGALFLVMLVLARDLGTAEVGRYAQCYALLALLSLLSLSGFRAGLTRFVAVHLADDDPASIRGTVRLGLAISAAGAVLIGVLLAIGAPLVADVLHDPALTGGLRLVALALPATVICEAALAATRGWRTQRPFTLVGQLYEPGARLVLTVVALLAGFGVTGALWAVVVAAWTAAALAVGALLRLMRTVAPAAPEYRPRQLFSFSTVSWASSLASTGLIWIDTLMLGAFANEDIGVYTVATRLVTVAIFVLAPINAAFGPYIAYLYHRDQFAEVRRVYRAATGWVVRLSLPAFVALLVFPSALLPLFGAGFAEGAAVTVVLAVGQLVNAATGPCGTLLNMSGRVALNMFDNIGALVLNIGLNLWLIPAHGIIGAAIAWSASLIAVNLARVAQVWWLVRAVPVTAGLVKGLAAGAAALVAALAVRWLVPEGAGQLVAGLAATVVVYGGAVLALGLSKEDTMVLRALARRRDRVTP